MADAVLRVYRGDNQAGTTADYTSGLTAGVTDNTTTAFSTRYTDQAGKLSKPSEPLKFTLKNRFGYK